MSSELDAATARLSLPVERMLDDGTVTVRLDDIHLVLAELERRGEAHAAHKEHVESLEAERDAARAEVERLSEKLDQFDSYGLTVGEALRERAERDTARAQVLEFKHLAPDNLSLREQVEGLKAELGQEEHKRTTAEREVERWTLAAQTYLEHGGVMQNERDALQSIIGGAADEARPGATGETVSEELDQAEKRLWMPARHSQGEVVVFASDLYVVLTALNGLRADLAKAQGQVAVMREALEEAWKPHAEYCGAVRRPHASGCTCTYPDAISSDAGKGWVSPEVWATGLCSAHQTPDWDCRICNRRMSPDVVAKMRGELSRGRTHGGCAYLAVGACNKCGWVDRESGIPEALALLEGRA